MSPAKNARPLIALYRETALISDDDVLSYMRAQQLQLDRDLLPFWGRSANLLFVPGGDQIPPDAWQCVFLDNSDQADALGYHELTAFNLPIMKVFVADDQAAGLTWTVTASHEMIETIGDPYIDQTVTLRDQATGFTEEYAFELCDCCEDDQFAYSVEDPVNHRSHLMSDFALPHWFMPGSAGAENRRYTFQYAVDGPFRLAAGGYIGVRELAPEKTEWTQRMAQLVGKRQQKADTSRTLRRFRRA